MQIKRSPDNSGHDVWIAGKCVGQIRRVPRNPHHGRGIKALAPGVDVWGAFIGDRRVGMDFATRKAAADAIEWAVSKV